LSLEFEGSFLNTELNGRADEATLASLAADGLAAYHTDLNAVFFMLNGHISLDLWRYRARIGKVLAGMRPYVGGGIGGGQLWFRNTFTQSKNQFTGVDTTTTASISPFAVDEFISAWQWYAGLEYSWQDKYSLYAEYREFHFGELEEVTDLIAKGWSLGFRYRY
jgi:opacity protein-like surface antigen